MRLPDVADGLASATAEAVRAAGALVSDTFDTTLRLGVTGLARSGKTVLITGLVRALVSGRAVPGLARLALIPGFRAYLTPQPDDDVPRFAYEEHLAVLAAEPPAWPESTRRISQLRLTLEWDGQDIARRLLGLKQRLHIDIVDYPGEWLIDLQMIGQSFADWSAVAIGAMRQPRRAPIAQPMLALLDGLAARPPERDAEAIAIEGAGHFTRYLAHCREQESHLAIQGPGRFLMPGDLAGSPLLTFFPLPAALSGAGAAAPLASLVARRFESYKEKVALGFFRDHFSRLDRQIVMVDLLSALETGPDALAELEDALHGLLAAFRLGPGSWLSLISGRRIDRVVFAASKADHLNHAEHARLAAILDKVVARAWRRGESAGIRQQSIALAALKATDAVETERGTERFPSIRGRPMRGETIGRRRYDGREVAVVFPGELPVDPLAAFDARIIRPGAHRFVRFAPPRIADASAPWPHIGLDAAILALIGDHLP